MIAVRVRDNAHVAGIRYGDDRLIRVVGQTRADFLTEHDFELAFEGDFEERDEISLVEAEALIEAGFCDAVLPDVGASWAGFPMVFGQELA